MLFRFGIRASEEIRATCPFALASGSMDQVTRALIGDPFDFSFQRPIGRGTRSAELPMKHSRKSQDKGTPRLVRPEPLFFLDHFIEWAYKGSVLPTEGVKRGRRWA